MAMMWKGIPEPVLAALILLIVGGLIHIIGLATPYWHSIDITNMAVNDAPWGHHGLWVACRNGAFDTVDCDSHSDTKGFVITVRSLEVLALLCGVACIIVTGLWFFLRIEKHRLILMISSLGSGFVAGLFGFIGIIIYAAEINANSRVTDQISVYNQSLSWSFVLCILSSILVSIATMLIGIGTRMMK